MKWASKVMDYVTGEGSTVTGKKTSHGSGKFFPMACFGCKLFLLAKHGTRIILFVALEIGTYVPGPIRH
jgi:hypothetical protein